MQHFGGWIWIDSTELLVYQIKTFRINVLNLFRIFMNLLLNQLCN